MNEIKNSQPTNKMPGSKKRLIFYIAMIAVPILQFCIFYIGVNFNVILLAFQKYDYYLGEYVFAGFQNIKQVFNDFGQLAYFKTSFINSFIACGITVFVGTTLALIFSYYIHIKAPASGFFRVMLFLPSVISSVAIVIVFKYFAELVLPNIWELITGNKLEGLLSNRDIQLPTLLIFGVWIGFGTPTLMYSGAMSSISRSISEAAKIDGAGPVKEFIHVILPMIYPTIVTFTIVNFSALFQNQINAYSFFGGFADYKVYTIGYYLYTRTEAATIAEYTYLSAVGLILTVFLVPATLLLRKGLEFFGPKVD